MQKKPMNVKKLLRSCYENSKTKNRLQKTMKMAFTCLDKERKHIKTTEGIVLESTVLQINHESIYAQPIFRF